MTSRPHFSKDTDITTFMDMAQELADKAEEGRRIKEAAEKGTVEPSFYHYDPAPGFDGRIREMARDVIFRIWELEKRPARLQEIYDGVRKEIVQDIEDDFWPKVWNATPSKRTIDRRAGELHENKAEFWPRYDFPPVMLLKPGYLQPNPRLFDEKVREEIVKA